MLRESRCMRLRDSLDSKEKRGCTRLPALGAAAHTFYWGFDWFWIAGVCWSTPCNLSQNWQRPCFCHQSLVLGILGSACLQSCSNELMFCLPLQYISNLN